MWYISNIISEIHHIRRIIMNRKKYLYGLTGLLSLLGFIGVFTGEKTFLAFFAFVVNFEYFFIKTDELLDEQMHKSAAYAFYCGMLAVAVISLISIVVNKDGSLSLINGLAAGWAVSIIVHSILTVYYGFREKWGLSDD